MVSGLPGKEAFMKQYAVAAVLVFVRGLYVSSHAVPLAGPC